MISKNLRTATFISVVLFLSSIGLVATDIYLPSFPSIQAAFHTQKIWVQLSLSLYLFGLAVSQLYYGPLSDRIGRKKTAQIGLIFSFFGTLLCLFSFDVGSLIAGRILQGVGLGAGAALARAIMRDAYSGDDLAHYGSYIIVGTAVLMAAAPAVGGYVQHFMGWRINFLILLIYTIFGLISVRLWLPETNRALNPMATKRKVFLQNYLHLFKSPIFVGYSLCSSLAFGGLSAYFTSSPFLFQTVMGLNSVQYGWLALLIGAGLGVGGFLNAYLVKLIGRHRTLVVGIAVVFFSGVLMLVLSLIGYLNVLAIMLPMGICTLGAAMVFANAVAGAFQPFAHMAGFAGALFGCIQFLGGTVSSGLIASVHEANQTPLALILISVGVCSYFLQLLAFSYATKQMHH